MIIIICNSDGEKFHFLVVFCSSKKNFVFVGAVTPVFAALLPPGAKTPRGEFLSKCEVQEWWVV